MDQAMNTHVLLTIAAAVVGVAVSSAHPAGIIAALLLLPVLVFRQPSRRTCYAAAICHYAGALWPLAVGARNFFGPNVSAAAAIAFRALCALLLALPFALLWTDRTRHLLWRAPLALLLGVVPPLGLIGFASPLTASGFLFPSWSWAGLVLSTAGCGFIAAYPRAGMPFIAALALIADLSYPGDPPPPASWQTVDTHLGAISHGPVSPLREYLAAQTIQQRACASSAKVVIFPESVVPRWTASTDLFWKPSIEAFRREGKTVLIGALVPESLPPQDQDLRAAVDLLRTVHEPETGRRLPRPPQSAIPYFYRNAVIIRGAQTGIFLQRLPVPVAVWKPFALGGAPLQLTGPAVLDLAGQRAALLICYEQVIPWTVWTAALAGPTLLVGMSNDYWATGTPIPRWQALCLHSWSRLFRVPYLLAVNT
jgi:predicted amidohydrolase